LGLRGKVGLESRDNSKRGAEMGWELEGSEGLGRRLSSVSDGKDQEKGENLMMQ
jgi:hypothetical protein